MNKKGDIQSLIVMIVIAFTLAVGGILAGYVLTEFTNEMKSVPEFNESSNAVEAIDVVQAGSITWIDLLFLFGLISYAVGMILSSIYIDASPGVTMVFIILMIVGIILLLKHAGPLGLFDITGYIGDWLSYARLLALGLGTAGMALAFNIIAQIIPEMIPVVGFIFTPIILIIAHTANLGLQTLGAGVHSIRLQYVEFFNRFYEGGGRKFEPFLIKRKYTKTKDIE